MTSLKFARRTAACAILAAAGVLALASASQANVDPNCNPDSGACAFSFDNPYAIDDVIPLDGCTAQFGTSGARAWERARRPVAERSRTSPRTGSSTST